MTRLLNAWGALGRDQRLAAMTSLGLFVSMLLPWYSKTVVVRTRGGGAGSQSLSAFQAFSFVEAAVLLVSVGVLAALFARAEERDFHLPGGDGTIVMLAGAWVAILIFYRLFDKPGLQGNEQVVSSVGVQWGIFVALLVALGLAYVGRRMRLGERGAPPLARRTAPKAPSGHDAREDDVTEAATVAPAPAPARAPATPTAERARRRERARYPPAPQQGRRAAAEQMSFEDEQAEEE